MSLSRARRGLFVVAASLTLIGCGARRHASDVGKDMSTDITIPPPRAPKVVLTPEEAALVYPNPASIDRDPFVLEQDDRDEDEPAFLRHRPKRSEAKEKVAHAVLKQLHATVTGIIIGPRNTFFFEGKLYEEGDRIPDTDWVVASITASAINLRSADGQTDRLSFVREGTSDFQFKRSQ